MYTLDQIRCLVAVAEELHFGRAAARLQMTQPPLSRQIQKLEKSLHVTLLRRDQRRVELTAAGSAFLDEARRLLVIAERAPSTARSIAAGHEGVVHMGFTATAGLGVLGDLLAAVEKELPRVALELSEMVTHDQILHLDEGSLDVGLARPPFGGENLTSRLLIAEDLLLAVPAGHPLALAGGVIDESQLRGVPLIMHSPVAARYFYDLIVRTFQIDHTQVVHTVGQVSTMIALVRAGRGVAFVPASARVLQFDGVNFLSLGERARGTVELHALWSIQNSNPDALRVVDLLRRLDPS